MVLIKIIVGGLKRDRLIEELFFVVSAPTFCLSDLLHSGVPVGTLLWKLCRFDQSCFCHTDGFVEPIYRSSLNGVRITAAAGLPTPTDIGVRQCQSRRDGLRIFGHPNLQLVDLLCPHPRLMG